MTLMLSLAQPDASSALLASAMQASQLAINSSGSCSCQLRTRSEHGLQAIGVNDPASCDEPRFGVVLRVFQLVLSDDVRILVEDEETSRAGE